MPKSQLHYQSQIPFIDYVPAEVKETSGDTWRIVFYVKQPGTNGMKRFRRRVKPMSNKKERMRYAKRICASINENLAKGWSPFNDGASSNEYILLSEALKRYKDQNAKLLKGGQIRFDTDRHYRSMLNRLVEYMKHLKKTDMFCAEFNRAFVTNYADYLFFTKKLSGRTVNNYISWCKTLGTFLAERAYIPHNTIKGIATYKVAKKKREVIDPATRTQIFEYLKETNTPYRNLCAMVFFCLIRRTEITKLKVSHLDLNNGMIIVPADVSKNKKTEHVTIPNTMLKLLRDHIKGAQPSDYIFSYGKFIPGEKPCTPKQITTRWNSVRDVLEFKQEYHFYSLKDAGITELFLRGLPSIKIRDQARHHDIKITESYTPRNYKKDDLLSNLDIPM